MSTSPSSSFQQQHNQNIGRSGSIGSASASASTSGSGSGTGTGTTRNGSNYTLPVLPPATPTEESCQLSVLCPPTPSASPTPETESDSDPQDYMDDQVSATVTPVSTKDGSNILRLLDILPNMDPDSRRSILHQLADRLDKNDLVYLSNMLSTKLKRDFLSELPPEVALLILSFIDDPVDLVRCSRVCKYWRRLVSDEQTWKTMCERSGWAHRATLLERIEKAKRKAAAKRNSNQSGSHHSHSYDQEQLYSRPPLLKSRLDSSYSGNKDNSLNNIDSFNQYRANGQEADEDDDDDDDDDFDVNNGSYFFADPDDDDDDDEEEEYEEEMGYENEDNSFDNEYSHQDQQEQLSTNNLTFSSTNATINTTFNPESSSVDRLALDSLQHLDLQLDSKQQRQQQQNTSRLERSLSSLSTPAHFEHQNNNNTNHINSNNNNKDKHLSGSSSLLDPWSSNSLNRLSVSTSSMSHNTSAPNTTTTTTTATTTTTTTTSSGSNNNDNNSNKLSKSCGPGQVLHNSSSTPDLKQSKRSKRPSFSYKTYFKSAFLTEQTWLRGPGRLLNSQDLDEDSVAASFGCDAEWIVVGMANYVIRVFEASTGKYVKTLRGHELGVWCLSLVSKGGGTKKGTRSKRNSLNNLSVPSSSDHHYGHLNASTSSSSSSRPGSASGAGMGAAGAGASRSPTPSSFTAPENNVPYSTIQQNNACGSTRGWGQPGAILVSGGCDRTVRVWDLESGRCLHVLTGHVSTIRCIKVLYGRPIAVSGSRDSTLRVWDIENGKLLHVLHGHQHSVRCLEVYGNRVVSGSYDTTCRVWDVDTGECLLTLCGHLHQIYSVAFDGERIVTGSLDSMVRIWSAETGECLALLSGHTSLVGQLQLGPKILVTGGSDGRVIAFSLETYECLFRLCAHDNSVTCLQFNERFIVTAGNDGKTKLFDVRTGNFIRELQVPCESVWRANFRDDRIITLAKRRGQPIMELRTFRPLESEL